VKRQGCVPVPLVCTHWRRATRMDMNEYGSHWTCHDTDTSLEPLHFRNARRAASVVRARCRSERTRGSGTASIGPLWMLGSGGSGSSQVIVSAGAAIPHEEVGAATHAWSSRRFDMNARAATVLACCLYALGPSGLESDTACDCPSIVRNTHGESCQQLSCPADVTRLLGVPTLT